MDADFVRTSAMVFLVAATANGCAFSCSGGGEKVAAGLEAVHDDQRGVTCWRSIFRSGNEVSVALSCPPDSAFTRGMPDGGEGRR